MFLTEEEIIELTGRVRWSAQLVALKRMHIDCKLNADGRPIVLRSHVEKNMGGVPIKQYEPDWSGLEAVIGK